jgi:hypothetical protein
MALSEDYGARLRFFEEARGELLTNIQTSPELQQGLGGFALTAARYLEGVYLANNDDGPVVLNDRGQESGGWPVVVMRPGEVARVTGNTATQTPRQRERTAELLEGMYCGDLPASGAVSRVLDEFQHGFDARHAERTDKCLSLEMGPGAGGVNAVESLVFRLAPDWFKPPSSSQDVEVLKRPVLGLELDSRRPALARQAPALFLHELVHTNSFEEHPVIPAGVMAKREWRITGEDQAYRGAGAYELILQAAGHPPYDDCAWIDAEKVTTNWSVVKLINYFLADATDPQERIEKTATALRMVGYDL